MVRHHRHAEFHVPAGPRPVLRGHPHVAMYVYAKERADFEATFAAAAVLLLLTALINLAALWTGRRLRR